VRVLRTSVIIHSTDHPRALSRYRQLLAVPPIAEFQLPGRDLVVTAFAGLSVLSGSAEAMAPVRDLRATVFVDSLEELAELLIETGWTREGALGPASSWLARDAEGNLLEFVEEVPPDPGDRRRDR
jgi:hypothetical protein